jgi:hypothetical protein
MHGYFPDPVHCQSLIKLRELRTLTSDEFSELPDAACVFVTAVPVVLQSVYLDFLQQSGWFKSLLKNLFKTRTGATKVQRWVTRIARLDFFTVFLRKKQSKKCLIPWSFQVRKKKLILKNIF